jgi:hypothetical protein
MKAIRTWQLLVSSEFTKHDYTQIRSLAKELRINTNLDYHILRSIDIEIITDNEKNEMLLQLQYGNNLLLISEEYDNRFN